MTPSPGTGEPTYMDHPSPSPLLVLLMLGCLAALLILGLPVAAGEIRGDAVSYVPVAVIGSCAVVLALYFWPLYGTYYTFSPAGLLVRFGPWVHQYRWTEFDGVRFRKGLFSSRIGSCSVAPCVRLTSAVVLRRKVGPFGLYLTPKDPSIFLDRLLQFAPNLTRDVAL